MATLIKRPNRNNWYVEFELNGKLKRVSTGVSLDGRKEGCSPRHAREIAQIQANRLEAVAKGNVSAQKMIAQIRAVSASGNIPTVREFLQQAIERRKKLNAEKTLGNDGAAIRRFLDWLGAQADAPLDSVNKAVALSFAEDQLQRVEESTVERYRKTLAACFKRGIEAEHVSVNPFQYEKKGLLKAAPPLERQAFTVDELLLMIEKLPRDFADMAQVCLYTGGQRLGDIVSMKWEQVDMANSVICMTTRKTRRHMVKPILEVLRPILQRRLNERINEYVFPMQAAKYHAAGGNVAYISIQFIDELEKLGIVSRETAKKEGDRRNAAEKSFHSLRRSAATMLHLAGVPLYLAQSIVGHDSEEVHRVYVKPSIEAIKEAMGALDLSKLRRD